MPDQSPSPPQTVVNVHLNNTNYATGAPAAPALEASRKSTLLAYLALVLRTLSTPCVEEVLANLHLLTFPRVATSSV